MPVQAAGLTLILATLAVYSLVSLPSLASRWGDSAAGVGVLALWLLLARQALPLIAGAPSRRRIALLAGAIVGLRLIAGILTNGRVSPGDSQAYLIIADHLLAGRGYYFDESYMGVRTFALFPPVYPLLLAGWAAVLGTTTWSLLALATLTDGLAAWLMAGIARRLGVAGAGRAAAFLYLIWPSALFSAPLAQKESLCSLLVLLLARAWIECRDSGSRGWRGAIALGVPAGLLALTQPGEAPLAALFGLALIGGIGWRRLLTFGLAGAAAATVVMLPWWVRNWIVFGAFVPLTTAGGIGLWIGNNPDATGNWIPLPKALRGIPEITYARDAAGLAKQWILAHPGEFLRLTATKFVRAVGVSQFGLVRLAAMYPPISAMIAAMLFPLTAMSQVLLLGGAAAAARARATPALMTLSLLIIACLAQLALFGVWFEFGERHREFATPFLLLLICTAVAAWQPRQRPTPRPTALAT